MRWIKILSCALAASALILSNALAANLEVDATVSEASYIGQFPGSVILNPPTAGQIGTWSGQLPLEFGENTPESLIVSDFPEGRLVNNGGTRMQNKLNMAWEPKDGSPGAFVYIPDGSDYVVVQDFDPGEFAGNLDFQQEVTYVDPVGTYFGSMTVYVGFMA